MADADRALGAVLILAIGILALAFPFVASGYHIYQGAQVLILAIALIGLNLLTGFNGQISLGHGAFFAIGGYGAAILSYKGFDAFTGGSQGLTLTKPAVPFGIALTPDQWLYLVCLAFAVALYWAARNLVRGRIGRALVAIRDQPIAAETMGINAALYKTTCFGVSALYAGVAGGLSTLAVGFVSPESFGL